MKHKPTAFHSDLIYESFGTDFNRSFAKVTNKKNDMISYSHIMITEEPNEFHKKKGTYITVSFEDLGLPQVQQAVIDGLIEAMRDISRSMDLSKVLMVGLGNKNILADSLGSACIDRIWVSAHIPSETRKVAAMIPGVMGQTGLETYDIIESIVHTYQPTAIIAIDALATMSWDRVNRVIQLTDTGIQPGSGVGHLQQEISKDTLGIDTIAIGVSTVIDVFSLFASWVRQDILPDAIMEQYSKMKDAKQQMIVTPKDMDVQLTRLADVIADSLNHLLYGEA